MKMQCFDKVIVISSMKLTLAGLDNVAVDNSDQIMPITLAGRLFSLMNMLTDLINVFRSIEHLLVIEQTFHVLPVVCCLLKGDMC
jgi:hypothetical protein